MDYNVTTDWIASPYALPPSRFALWRDKSGFGGQVVAALLAMTVLVSPIMGHLFWPFV